MRTLKFILPLTVILLIGCGTPKPHLFPNDRFKATPPEQVQKDMDACYVEADKAVESDMAKQTARGAASGAVLGAVATGVSCVVGGWGECVKNAAVGAAGSAAAGAVIGADYGRKVKNPVFRNYVDYCLIGKGYRPMGWR